MSRREAKHTTMGPCIDVGSPGHVWMVAEGASEVT